MDITSLPQKDRARANRRILIASALFGVVSATDRIPAYRLSAGSTLPGLPGLAAFWKPSLTKALVSLRGPILDLRSGSYRNLAPITGAVTVQVLSERPDGTRQVVSHFNKAAKGLVARAVAVADPVDTGGVIDVLTAAGLRVELSSPAQITVITAPQGPTPSLKPVV